MARRGAPRRRSAASGFCSATYGETSSFVVVLVDGDDDGARAHDLVVERPDTHDVTDDVYTH